MTRLAKSNQVASIMGSTSKYDGITKYRLDRMDHVEIIDDPVDENAIIRHTDDSPRGTYLHRTVDIQKSPTFWGWLFTFGQDMKILAPEPLVKDWKEQVEKHKVG